MAMQQSLMDTFLEPKKLVKIGGGDENKGVEKGEVVINANAVKEYGGGDWETGAKELNMLNHFYPRSDMPHEMYVEADPDVESPVGFQYGGINIGGDLEGYPSLSKIYNMYGSEPSEDFTNQFRQYDPSKEKNLWQSFWGQLTSAFSGSQNQYGQEAAEARSFGGSFAGAGGRTTDALAGERRGILGEFVNKVQGEMMPALTSDITNIRQSWADEQFDTLADLEQTSGALQDIEPSVFTPIPFPTNPTHGDQHYNGEVWYTYDNGSWLVNKGLDPEDGEGGGENPGGEP
jgi:hypothetical protein